ncbi:MAG: MFS transporter, partial [Microbacteriaceae bacterium]
MPWFTLLVIAGAIFVSVTSEFLPAGLLPEIAADLDVSESRVGVLVTAFAATVVVATAPLTALTRRLPRKPLLVGAMLIGAVGNALAAFAPSYEVLLGSRILAGLSYGLFWALVMGAVARVVAPEQLARAVAVALGGGTTAFVLGIPLGTALGTAVGWRTAFVVIAAAILLLGVLVAVLLPHLEQDPAAPAGERTPIWRAGGVRSVLLLCLVVIVSMGAHYVFYTYIASYAIEVGGFDERSVSLLLFAYGAAGALGLLGVGVLGDRHPRVAVVGGMLLAASAVALLVVFPGVPWLLVAVLVVWGFALGGVPAMLQSTVLRVASPRIRDLSSAVYSSSFNFAIGGGALLGAGILDVHGLVGLVPVAAFGLALGAVIAAASGRRPARR